NLAPSNQRSGIVRPTRVSLVLVAISLVILLGQRTLASETPKLAKAAPTPPSSPLPTPVTTPTPTPPPTPSPSPASCPPEKPPKPGPAPPWFNCTGWWCKKVGLYNQGGPMEDRSDTKHVTCHEKIYTCQGWVEKPVIITPGNGEDCPDKYA